MASRKQTAVGSSQSFDASKFASFEAHKWFMDHIKLKVIQEIGLVQTVHFEINQTIELNKWELFF